MVSLCLRKRTSVRSDANRRLRGFTGRRFLSEALPDLLRSDGSDAVQAKCKDYPVFVPQPSGAGVDVAAKVSEGLLGRTITHVNVQRREPARHRAIAKRGKRIDGIKLITLPRNQRAAKKSIEEVFAANRDRQRFVRLRR